MDLLPVGRGDENPEGDVDQLSYADQAEDHEADPHQSSADTEAVGDRSAHPGEHAALSWPGTLQCGGHLVSLFPLQSEPDRGCKQ